MSKLSFLTTSEDMNALHALTDKRGASVKVPKDKLHNLLLDHAKLLQRLKPGDVVESVEDLI